MEEIEKDLQNGNTVICAACPNEIELGDPYVMRGKYMFCDEECAEEGVKGRDNI